MEFEEILGPQFTGSWSTCSPIPGKRFPITYHHHLSPHLEYTKEYTGHDNGLYTRRAGWGSQIKQKKGSSNC